MIQKINYKKFNIRRFSFIYVHKTIIKKKDMETVQRTYWGKKRDYTFSVYKIEERKNDDGTYYMKICTYSGYIHNCGPDVPHMVRRVDTHDKVIHEIRALLYDEDLKGYHQISKENYDKIAELYDNYRKVFVETGRKIKKLIKK